ncbi:MAG: response regulator [Hyphomonadaceae bacterium]|nr:response regulator [Hyphomonadaceae bacterium]
MLDRTSPTVLLVDDDADLRAALTFLFETEGYAVHAFASAEAALESDESSAACLVLDQRLPGLSGLDLLERMRAQGFSAPAILITTHPSGRERARARAAKAQVLEKPLLGDELAKLVGGASRAG